MTMTTQDANFFCWYPTLSTEPTELNRLNLEQAAGQLTPCANHPNSEQAGTYFRPSETYARILEDDRDKVEVVFFQYIKACIEIFPGEVMVCTLPDYHRVVVDVPRTSIRNDITILDIFQLVSDDWRRRHLRLLFIDNSLLPINSQQVTGSTVTKMPKEHQKLGG